MKNIGQMLKQAQQMQAKMAEMQAQLADTTVDGVAGAGLVTVTLNGKGEMKGLEIDRSLMKPDETEILEDLVAAQTTPREQVDLTGDPVHLDHRLECGVAPADHRDPEVLEQRTITGGAVDDPLAEELRLARDLELPLLGPTRDDRGVPHDHPARARGEHLAAPTERDVLDPLADLRQRHLDVLGRLVAEL